MEPQYRFCTSADGTKIAFSTLGGGRRTPVISVVSWAQVQERDWRSPFARAALWPLAEDRCVVGFDRRGVGASQRSVEDLSLEAQVADLRAVAEQLEFELFDLAGVQDGNAVALAYAARYPEHVRRMILWSPFARGADVMDAGQWRGLVELVRGNWEMATRTIANVIAHPSGPVETQREYAKVLRESVSPEVAARYIEFMASVDVSALLPRVLALTLIFHARKSQAVPISAVRVVAELIPDARLILLEGDNYYESGEETLEGMREFLDEQAAVPATGLVTILFTDITDSTGLTERLGDTAFRDRSRALDEALRALIREAGGKAVEGKLLGDGIMAVFNSAREAIECALRCGAASDATDLRLHLGLHAGDVIHEAGNVYGGAVNIASRIAGASAPGEVLVSDIVRGLARTSANVSFLDRGEHQLKGVSDPVRLYEVRWREDG
jgi:class 3 adenylate cyclase